MDLTSILFCCWFLCGICFLNFQNTRWFRIAFITSQSSFFCCFVMFIGSTASFPRLPSVTSITSRPRSRPLPSSVCPCPRCLCAAALILLPAVTPQGGASSWELWLAVFENSQGLDCCRPLRPFRCGLPAVIWYQREGRPLLISASVLQVACRASPWALVHFSGVLPSAPSDAALLFHSSSTKMPIPSRSRGYW